MYDLIMIIMSLCVIFLCVLKIEELGAQGMVDEAQSLMTQVEELEKEKNSYSARSGSRVCTHNDLQAPMCMHICTIDQNTVKYFLKGTIVCFWAVSSIRVQQDLACLCVFDKYVQLRACELYNSL